MGWLSTITAGSPGGFLFGLASFVVTNLVWFIMIRMSLAAAHGDPVALPDMTGRWDLFVTYLVATFLYGLGVAIGLVLLIVPGIMFAVAYWFYGFIIVDTGSDPITALQEARSQDRRDALLEDLRSHWQTIPVPPTPSFSGAPGSGRSRRGPGT